VKLLLDHNLSPKLVHLLADVYPECTHVHAIGMERASDTEVWRYAAEHGFAIVSRDSDFPQRSLCSGLRERYIPVRRFVEESTADFLIVS
jgi:predicted nuclease of predicted toxin-antitoxin system